MGANPGAQRDLRIDFFRGLALLFIFVDHVPGNVLGHFTLRNFGFADAAEVFVLLGGFSAVLAYGATYEHQGFQAGTRRVLNRVREIYFWHQGLLFVCVLGLLAAAKVFGNASYVHNIGLQIFIEEPRRALALAATLVNQPNSLNILPLYVVLLLFWMPLILWLIPRQPAGALALSVAVWALANLMSANLPSHQHQAGWVFNPLAWQLLITIGALAAYFNRRGKIPLSRPLLWIAAGYLVFAFIVAAPWTRIPGLQTAHVVPRDLLGSMSKSYVSPWRLAHVLALGYLAMTLLSPQSRTLSRPWTMGIGRCGRHALAIFCLGTVLSFCGWVIFSEVGDGVVPHVLVNAVGIGLLWGAAWLLSEREAGSVVAGAWARPLAGSRSQLQRQFQRA